MDQEQRTKELEMFDEWANHPVTIRVMKHLESQTKRMNQVTFLSFEDRVGEPVPLENLGAKALTARAGVKVLEQITNLRGLRNAVFNIRPEAPEEEEEETLEGFE